VLPMRESSGSGYNLSRLPGVTLLVVRATRGSRTRMRKTYFFLLLLAEGVQVLAQDGAIRAKVSLSRGAGAEDPVSPKDMSGQWTGTVQNADGLKPIYLILRQSSRALNGTMGPDPEHQLPIRNVSLLNGAVRFTTDLLSEVNVTLKDGQLNGEIVRLPDVRPNIHLPDETAGFDKIVQTLISAFNHADVVALGDSHRRKLDSDLRIRLVRHPEFAKRVHFIVVEFGTSLYQSILDRYIQGEDVPLEELQQVWTNTTQGSVWESPVYADFFAAVREVNKKLPAGKRVRVLAGDPPPGRDDRPEDRDNAAAAIVREQVLNKGSKALIIYGSGHLDRTGGITRALQSSHPGRIFVVDTLGGPYPEYQQFERTLKSPVRPVLVSLRRTPFQDFSANEFLGRGGIMRLGGVEVPVYPPGLTLGHVGDACVYLGNAADVETRVPAAH
jgi:hypothetical protein